MEFDLTTLAKLAAIFVLAFTAESMTEYLARPFVKLADKVAGNGNGQRVLPEWALRYAAALVGVLLAFGFAVDVFALFGLAAVHPAVGIFLTGLVLGRGANYLNDLVSRWRAPVVRE